MPTDNILEFLTTDSRPQIAKINRDFDALIMRVNELREDLIFKTAFINALERVSKKGDWELLSDRALTLLNQNFQ